ncbi:hypothetical protein EC988_010319, partial [Linderina pennispora]
GFNVMGRYLIVLYYQTNHRSKKTDLAKEEERIAQLRQRYKEMNPDGDDDLS